MNKIEMINLTAAEAVRIARSGEGAIVSELLRLSRYLTAEHNHVIRLQMKIEESIDDKEGEAK